MNNNMLIEAMPTKDLFIDTLTRDVNITDAILDLVDNAIDGYTRNNIQDRREINLKISKNEFLIHDTCGGIDVDSARKDVFRFGVVKGSKHSLGVYGIGLKRSIFKLGSTVAFESDNGKNYFRVDIDVNEWKKSDDWNFQFTEIKNSTAQSFTRLKINEPESVKFKAS